MLNTMDLVQAEHLSVFEKVGYEQVQRVHPAHDYRPREDDLDSIAARLDGGDWRVRRSFPTYA